MFDKILIANRGEIACRVASTARRLGIQTVAVYSDADANARHVALCDEAVAIGPAPARDSYLNIDRIIAAAVHTGAQAIHPGYGFLSENAAFAEACAAAGIAFIGPPASAIRAMGSKAAAKSLMEQAAVPLVPGYHGDNQDAAFLHQQADAIGYPVLLKASAGGGGKGMRIVDKSDDFEAALASCRREAANSFGDDRVLIEKYLIRPRHIEIQVFADTHGNCVYLFERDCSVQRRHQKVLEEAPAPGMTDARRRAMGEAAVAAAKAVGYVGAGTVEFIANQDGTFYFMEMNTRLQVEHPVTEMITGLDLVEWQLRVAAGESLPRRQEELSIQGHAIEARVYAENPEKGFLPSIGTLKYLRTPPALEFTVHAVTITPSPLAGEGGGEGASAMIVQSHARAASEQAAVRIDSGIRQGDTITPHYDPMIAKLIVWGRDRDQALTHLAKALSDFQVVGLATNLAFLKRVVQSRPFASADLDTGLIERHHAELFPAPAAPSAAVLALAVMALIDAERSRHAADADPWSAASGWRLNSRLKRTFQFADICADGEPVYDVQLTYAGDAKLLRIGAQQLAPSQIKRAGHAWTLRIGEQAVRGDVVIDGELLHIFTQGAHSILRYDDPLAHADAAEQDAGTLSAPMPGKIVALMVKPGDKVAKGAPLLIMEAMKMEHTIAAPAAGVVEQVPYALGDQVAEGAQLLVLRVDE